MTCRFALTTDAACGRQPFDPRAKVDRVADRTVGAPATGAEYADGGGAAVQAGAEAGPVRMLGSERPSLFLECERRARRALGVILVLEGREDSVA